MLRATEQTTEVQGMQEMRVYARLSAEINGVQLQNREMERAMFRELQEARSHEGSLRRCETLLHQRNYDYTETEVELRNTEEHWMQMLAESGSMLRLEVQIQSALANESAKYLEAETLVSLRRIWYLSCAWRYLRSGTDLERPRWRLQLCPVNLQPPRRTPQASVARYRPSAPRRPAVRARPRRLRLLSLLLQVSRRPGLLPLPSTPLRHPRRPNRWMPSLSLPLPDPRPRPRIRLQFSPIPTFPLCQVLRSLRPHRPLLLARPRRALPRTVQSCCNCVPCLTSRPSLSGKPMCSCPLLLQAQIRILYPSGAPACVMRPCP